MVTSVHIFTGASPARAEVCIAVHTSRASVHGQSHPRELQGTSATERDDAPTLAGPGRRAQSEL